MVDVPTFINVPIFGSGSTRTAPAAGVYTGGYLPGQVLPAENQNFFLNGLTGNGLTEQTDLVSIVSELKTLLTRASITPNPGLTNQVSNALDALYAGIWTVTTLSLGNSDFPYSLIAKSASVVEINSTLNPAVLTLPVATGSGWPVELVNTSALVTGLVKILPHAGDKIGPLAANVAAYLQNVDQSGWAFAKQGIRLIDVAPGQWAVAGGQFMPEPGSVDNAGTQYFFGTFIRFPTGNNTLRNVFTGAPPTVSTFGSAIQVTGLFGVPAGAKGIRVKVRYDTFAAVSGNVNSLLMFSDNNSVAPTFGLADPHPGVTVSGFSNTAGFGAASQIETDIPLNSLGQFYIYGAGYSNVTQASSQIAITVIGYWMGI